MRILLTDNGVLKTCLLQEKFSLYIVIITSGFDDRPSRLYRTARSMPFMPPSHPRSGKITTAAAAPAAAAGVGATRSLQQSPPPAARPND